MDKDEVSKFTNILQFLDDGIKNISGTNLAKEKWFKNFPKEIFEFKSLSDKFVKLLEFLGKKGNIEERKKNKEIKEYLINLNNIFNPNLFKYQEGRNYLDKKEYDKAIECWRQIPPDYPGISDVYTDIGLAFMEKDNDQEALEWFSKSYELRQDPIIEKLIFRIQFDLAVIKDYAYFRQWQVNTSQHYEKLKAIKKEADLTSLNKKYPTQYHQLEQAIDMNKRLCSVNLTNMEEGLKLYREYAKYFPDDPNLPQNLKDFMDLTKLGAYRLIPNKISQNVKNIILELGNKFNRLQINEIAEKCNEPEDVIIVILKQMLKNNEIIGEYFQSSKSIVFDQKSNKVKISDQLLNKKEVNIVTLNEDTIVKSLRSNIEQLFSSPKFRNLFQMVNEMDISAHYGENRIKVVCKNCNKLAKDNDQKICEFCGSDLY